MFQWNESMQACNTHTSSLLRPPAALKCGIWQLFTLKMLPVALSISKSILFFSSLVFFLSCLYSIFSPSSVSLKAHPVVLLNRQIMN